MLKKKKKKIDGEGMIGEKSVKQGSRAVPVKIRTPY